MATTSTYRATNASLFSTSNEIVSRNVFTFERTCAEAFADDVVPAYDFRSSSSFVTTPAGMAGGGMTYRISANPWADPEEDDPIGVVPDPVPVGEPLVLVVMAMLYGVVLYLRRRRMMSNPQ